MKKLLLAIVLVCGALGAVIAQTRTVTGVVTDQSGEGLIGASIAVKGTTTGTVSDFDGTYSIRVPETGGTLVFSYTGFSTEEVEIGSQSVINISLQEGVVLSEAVVTALGVQREEKALGYAVQEIESDQLNLSQDPNVISSLSGKVAGVQIISSSGASLGGSAKVRIRGVSGLTGGDPLYIVDGTPISNDNFSGSTSGSDYGNLATDINPNDVEKVSVLKGPAATALYGERASNGVVLITTKKGNYGKKGIGVSVTSSVTADRVYILPNYQNEYAGGYSQEFEEYVDPVDGQTYKGLLYAADESWGPRMDGTQYRPWWSWLPGDDYGTQIPLEAQPDNVRDFFETGLSNINTVAINGGAENMGYRFSFTNQNQGGVIPNSELDKNIVQVNLNSEIVKNLSLEVNANFSSISGLGRPEFGYNGDNPLTSFNQWFQRQLSMDRLADYKNPDGTFRSWNMRSPTNTRPQYWDSPYFSVFENYSTDSRSRYYGNIGLTYQVSDNLTIKGAIRRDDYTQRLEERNATGGLDLDRYREFVAQGREDNYELLAVFADNFGKFSLDATLGGNIRNNSYHSDDVSTAGGLTAPNLFNIEASVDRPNVARTIRNKKVNSVFGSATLGYNSFAYLGVTLRNDWSSALPANNNGYLYPSISGSLVFSELLNSNVISFGKLYGSVAQVGADLNPYQTNLLYNFGANPYGSNATFSVPNTLPNQDLLQTLSTSWETGIDVRMFNDRFGFNAIYYEGNVENDILTVQIPGSSGYSSALVNAGLFTSKGIELALYGTPVRSGNFNWDVRLNYARNRTTVEKLYQDLGNYKLADGIGGQGWGGFTINAIVGQEWGLARGRGFTYDDAGNYVITEGGRYVIDNNKDLGSILPDFQGGFLNTFTIGNFSINAMIDFQAGGQFFSVTKMFNAYSGLGEDTVGDNALGNPVRDPVLNTSGEAVTSVLRGDAAANSGGVLVEGVSESGEPLSVLVDAVSYYGRLFGVHERWLYDASYVKLRELSVGYTLPKEKLGNLPVQSIGFSLIGRNLWLINSNVDGLDPSEILPGANNLVFEERGGLPGVRSFGARLNVTF
ncbi:SusC/RagA family TonB-linked outer membrane protein [Flavilitoribacter nigricans DSM 23189 = NBRC 102662]|uniref:SusC/RagA family TonB-linked outer membrane protein n=1 Tax=Flavilitoribacter nigricans (strain ATCC 23147 / DSM 23189 / NBRC 102662 / NCIMB 1420 / SS-2) TaxID=1122177 RepID=A0A2D0NFE7_FLAN2|nr:SusC/RagA family TonB-linked outer membrane protein [Flavilitoribacter nigricans DSM 23189 = NBRC 102662]